MADADQTFTICTPLLTGRGMGRGRGNGIAVLAPGLATQEALPRPGGLTGRMLSGQSTD